MKFEWPLLLPENKDVISVSENTRDITQYIVEISKNFGLAEGLVELEGGVTMHVACHSRAQNMGQKGVEMLRLIPNINLNVIERCSGHGGSWGVLKDNFEVALKIGRPAARKINEINQAHVISECPLAREHLLQGAKRIGESKCQHSQFQHPIELLAFSYGIKVEA